MFYAFPILLLLSTSVLASAQQQTVKHGYIGHRDQSLSFGYGLGAVQNHEQADASVDSATFFGPLWMSYQINLGNALAIGGEVGYHELTAPQAAAIVGQTSGTNRTVHVAVCGEWTWYRGRWLTASTGAAIGLATIMRHIGTPSSSILPAYHVGLLALRVTGDVGFRLEVGYGYRGVVNAGMSFVM